MNDCVFCKLLQGGERNLVVITMEWVGFRPIGPVSDRHLLLIPRRHVERLEQLTPGEAGDLPYAMRRAVSSMGVDSYNVGVNAGAAAGQTVFHLHVHLIPREVGDVPDPRGGIITPLGQMLPGSRFHEYLAGKS